MYIEIIKPIEQEVLIPQEFSLVVSRLCELL